MSDQEVPQEPTATPPPEPEKPPKKGIDWLTVALVLVIVANIGLYVYNTRTRTTPRPQPNVAGGPQQPGPPPSPGGPGGPGGPGRPGPGGPGGPPPSPGAPGSPPVPPSPASVPEDVALLVTSPEGIAALMDLGNEPPPKGLTPDQKKRLVAALGTRLAARDMGNKVAEMQVFLQPAQMEFLRARKGQMPPSSDPVQQAVELLKKKAAGADAAAPAGEPSGPEFDPVSFAQGLLLLEGQKDLGLQPAQAAAILPILEATAGAGNQPAEDPAMVLTPDQREWLKANAPKADVSKHLGEATAEGTDLSNVLQERMAEEFSK